MGAWPDITWAYPAPRMGSSSSSMQGYLTEFSHQSVLAALTPDEKLPCGRRAQHRGPLVRSRPVSMRRTDRWHRTRRRFSRPPMMHSRFPRYRPVGSAGAYCHCNRRMSGRRQGHITRNIATKLERTHQHPPPPSPPRTIHPSLFRPSMASSPSLCFRRHEQVRRLMVRGNG